MKWINVGQLKYGKNPPITLILVNIKITVMKKKKKGALLNWQKKKKYWWLSEFPVTLIIILWSNLDTVWCEAI